jgi:hypothetical protein
MEGSHDLFAQAGLELILLNSASQVARITGVNHQHLVSNFNLFIMGRANYT